MSVVHIDSGGVYFVVLGVRADELNVHRVEFVSNARNQKAY